MRIERLHHLLLFDQKPPAATLAKDMGHLVVAGRSSRMVLELLELDQLKYPRRELFEFYQGKRRAKELGFELTPITSTPAQPATAYHEGFFV